jgi:1-aminocyclopropane-1-carboxylate deaminase/D-cysteine desulfhydrase-like pyridoxal-dependent ACC family enzyme
VVTPWEQHAGYWVKRDDLFEDRGVKGGKGRTLLTLARGATGLVAAGSRQSTQINRVAQAARALGLPCQIHLPASRLPDTPEIAAAGRAGAALIRERPGYLGVLTARARAAARERGWRYVPFGMECPEAIAETRAQVPGMPDGIERLVVPAGGGMTLAGVLWGLEDMRRDVPVLGVMVGADPTARLDVHAPPFWRGQVTLVSAGLRYERPAPQQHLGGLVLDPIYEAKCLPFLRPGDGLWVVDCRLTARRADGA